MRYLSHHQAGAGISTASTLLTTSLINHLEIIMFLENKILKLYSKLTLIYSQIRKMFYDFLSDPWDCILWS